jgi:hypothetical protein
MKPDRCFGGICSLHLQDRSISQARNRHDGGSKQIERGDVFLRNVGSLSKDYMALYPIREISP